MGSGGKWNGAPRPADSFERRVRRRGGSSQSYSQNLSKPAHVRKQRTDLLVMLALTLVIPPVGSALLWYKGALNVKVRALVTAVALLLTTLYFSWMLPSDTPEPFQPTVSRPEPVTEYSPSSVASQTE